MPDLSATTQTPNTAQYGRSDAGSFDAIYQMARLVRSATLDRFFANFARQQFPDKSDFNAIYNWVVNSVVVIRNRSTIETIKPANRTISDGFGDVDDIAVLFASILAVLGYRPRFVLAFNKANDIDHIYVDVETDSRYVFDATFPTNKPTFNRERESVSIATIDIWDDKNLNSIYGVFRQITLGVKESFHNAADLLFYGSNFLPLPVWGGTHLGANLIESALTKTDSLSDIGADVHKQLDRIITALLKQEVAHSIAKLQALQIASRLNVRDVSTSDRGDYELIRQTIERKLDWINNHTKTADEIELRPQMMLGLGAIFVSGALGYYFLKTR